MAVIKQLRIAMKNRPGALAELCTELAKRAVNISAIQASETSPDLIRLVASPLDTAKKVCELLQLDFREEEVIAAHMADRPGSLGRVTRKLAEKGINIEYVYGSIGKSAERALVVLGVDNVAAASRILK